MQLFTPTTVSGAIAPFQKVVRNLKSVIAAQARCTNVSHARINAAKSIVQRVEKTENAAITVASDEKARAIALLNNLEALLSTDAPIGPTKKV